MSIRVFIRKAEPADVEAVFQLLELYTADGIVLKRSREDISDYLKNFSVAVVDGRVCGCCAARDFGNNLFEIRSLVIHPDHQGQGIGRKLVESIIERLGNEQKDWRLFTLTLQVEFFRKLGFVTVEKERFPEKIWSDCTRCPKFHCCDETALIYTPVR